MFVLQTTFSDAQTNLIHLKQMRKGTSPIKNKIIESFANHLYLHPKALPSIVTAVLGPPLWLGAILEECVLVPGFSMALTRAAPTPRREMGTLPAQEQGNDHGNGAMVTGTGRWPWE